jgi:cytochrome c-type biogenesis protein CcmF
VQAPYFNAFAPFIGLGLIMAIAVGNLMRYQSNKFAGGARPFVMGALFAIPLSSLFFYFGDVTPKAGAFSFGFAAQIVGIYLSFWSMGTISWDFLNRLKEMQWKLAPFLKRNLSYTGAYVAHIGLIVAIMGFLGNYRAIDKLVTMKAGESVDFYGYTFQFEGMKVRQEQNATVYAAPLEYYRDGRPRGVIEGGQSRYPTKPEPLTEIGLRSYFWHDLYVVLADFDRETMNSATLHIHINPTVRIVWLSCVLMVLGGLIAVFDRYRGQKSRDVIAGEWDLGHLR